MQRYRSESLPITSRHIRHQSPTWTNSSTGPCPPVSVKTTRRSLMRSESRGNGQTDSGKHSGRTVARSGMGEVPGLGDVMGFMSGKDVRPPRIVTETSDVTPDRSEPSIPAMNEDATADTVAGAWRLHRRRVLDVCYRMLGTLADAEDAVQETYARLVQRGTGDLDDVAGWLVTVAGRVCLDRLRADRVRSRYVGPWLPSPVLQPHSSEPDPADRVTLDDSVRFALLTVL